MAFSLGEYQDIFLEEADEQLQELNQNLLELEKNPDDNDIINNIFRAAHSLKSSAAFVGLNDLSDLAHKMENLLQGIRDKTMKVTPVIVDIIFKCFDEINSVIETVAGGEEPTQDLNWIISEIQSVSENSLSGKPHTGENVKKHKGTAAQVIPETVLDDAASKEIIDAIETGNSCFEITVFIDNSAQMKWVKAQLVIGNLERLGNVFLTFPPSEGLNDEVLGDVFKVLVGTSAPVQNIMKACDIDLITKVEIKRIDLDETNGLTMLKFVEFDAETESKREAAAVIHEKSEVQETCDDETPDKNERRVESQEKSEIKFGRRASDNLDSDKKKAPVLKTVKVSVDKLDELLNNVAELVIANSGFYRLYEEIRKASGEKTIVNEFKSRMEDMSRIAKDLQAGIMKTRMVPIGQVFTRYNRLIRDLAKEHNKKVQLIIKGEDTELDKKVIDVIGEPLLHLIRNAVDHGIESNSERKTLGKAEVASVTLNAHQGGNQIFVEVSDDGNGLDVNQIKQKVIEKGLSTPEIIANMDDADIFNFIFAPGFSTAKKITDISGRGVGMNVVKEIVNELNGNVSIETEKGMGTRFILAFPLTLAIIPAIMVKVSSLIYAIPLSDVVETIKIPESDITTIEGHEVINLRGEILSLVRLNEFIGENSSLTDFQKIPVVVVGFGNRKIGLIVDSLEGKLEIVIKSLEQNYKNVEGLAGASILGDGSIALILDINTMISRVISEQDRLTRFEKNQVLKRKGAEIEKAGVAETKKDRVISVDTTTDVDILESTIPVHEEIHVEIIQTETKLSEEPVQKEPVNEIFEENAEVEQVSVEEPVIYEEEVDTEIIPDEDIGKNVLIEGETTPVARAKEESAEVDERVHEALKEFKEELKSNIKSALVEGGASDHIEAAFDVSQDDLREFQLAANVGATNAAESLSRIINKRIDLSIPEVSIRSIESIPEYLGSIDSVYIGVMLPILGQIKGTILLILGEQVGFELIDMLYGSQSSDKKTLTEDGESALKELTNIVGSSVLNIFAEKTELLIKPSVPTIVHDYMQSVIDSILVLHNIANDYAVVMDTSFFFEDDRIIGNLLLFPEAESLKKIVEGLRSNVGSN